MPGPLPSCVTHKLPHGCFHVQTKMKHSFTALVAWSAPINVGDPTRYLFESSSAITSQVRICVVGKLEFHDATTLCWSVSRAHTCTDTPGAFLIIPARGKTRCQLFFPHAILRRRMKESIYVRTQQNVLHARKSIFHTNRLISTFIALP